MASFSDGDTIHIVYQGSGVYYATVNSQAGERAEELNGAPKLVIGDGSNPALAVSGDGKTFIVADTGGETFFTTCNVNEEDCSEARETGTNAQTEFSFTFGSGIETYSDDSEDIRDSRNTADEEDAYVVDPHPAYDTLPDTQWISHSPDGLGKPDDTVTYTALFELPDGFENPSITIDLHADNVATIFLNGEQIGQQPPGEIEVNFQDPPESFSATAPFVEGENELVFEVENFNDPSGLDYFATVTYELGEIIPTFQPSGIIPSLQSVAFIPFFGTPQIIPVQASCDVSTPRIAADGDDLYIVQVECNDIIFYASHDGGQTFDSEDGLNLSNNAGVSKDPRIALTGDGTIVVTWQDNTPGNDEILYSRSTDDGETFNGGSPVGSPINLSNTNKKSDDHQLKALDDDVYVTWVDYKTGNGDVYFKASKDNNGASFGATKNLSTSLLSFLSSRDPDLAAHGTKVSVVWSVHTDKSALRPGEIIFRQSANEGDSFGKQILVSKTLQASKTPQVDYTPDDGEIYIAWLDKGGPARSHIASGTFAVLAVESDDGKIFSKPVNLTDDPANPKPNQDASLLEVVHDVATWDPSSRRG
jgi:hypothetical protein